MFPVVVLKFGSSVLESPTDLPTAVDEIYRRMRRGSPVLAVVSAFAGETDRLISEASMILGDAAAPEAIAAYVATGEVRTAALLLGALLRAGIAARQVDPREIQLRVDGDLLESDPVSVNVDALRNLWGKHSTLVLPGFFGIDDEGHVALLGRGGSDLSALFLADALKADCHLIKDVSGVYDRDPAQDPTAARRYSVIPWGAAEAVAGRLIQRKALEFSLRRRIPFSVSRASDALSTRVSDAAAHLLESSKLTASPIRVALLGFGTVGQGVFDRLVAQPERFALISVVTRDPAKSVAKGLPPSLASGEVSDALASDIDLLIECIGGVEPASTIIKTALTAGKSVVSANKAAIAAKWADFEPYSIEPRRQLWYSAAVGGAVPVLETLGGLCGQVREVRGVINGTANFVLDSIASGESFDSVVRAAQAAGFAEADPSRDLGGADALDKLTLIARGTFASTASIVIGEVHGITPDLACDSNHPWRQIGRAAIENGMVSLSVKLQRVSRRSFFGAASGAENRFEIELHDGRILRMIGQGAGRQATTTSVVADILEVWRRHQSRSTS